MYFYWREKCSCLEKCIKEKSQMAKSDFVSPSYNWLENGVILWFCVLHTSLRAEICELIVLTSPVTNIKIWFVET